MNRYCMFIFIFIFSISLCFAKDKVSLANDPWPPYVFGETADATIATSGIAVELIQLIFDRIEDTDAEIQLIPWKRALAGVDSGDYDGIPILFKTKKREKFIDYSGPLFQARTVFFYDKSRFPKGVVWSSYEDLTPYKIAVQDSFSVTEMLEDQVQKGVSLELVKVMTDKDCFRLLTNGRVDLVATNEIVGKEMLKQQGVHHLFVASSQSLYEKSFHIGFSKKTDARKLIPQINKIIIQLRSEGLIEKVLSKE